MENQITNKFKSRSLAIRFPLRAIWDRTNERRCVVSGWWFNNKAINSHFHSKTRREKKLLKRNQAKLLFIILFDFRFNFFLSRLCCPPAPPCRPHPRSRERQFWLSNRRKRRSKKLNQPRLKNLFFVRNSLTKIKMMSFASCSLRSAFASFLFVFIRGEHCNGAFFSINAIRMSYWPISEWDPAESQSARNSTLFSAERYRESLIASTNTSAITTCCLAKLYVCRNYSSDKT